jgi:hypothetical protein
MGKKTKDRTVDKNDKTDKTDTGYHDEIVGDSFDIYNTSDIIE